MRCLGLGVLLAVWALPAAAQSVSIDLGAAGQSGATMRLVQLTALIGVLSLAPCLLVMATAFTRIAIVLSLLRSALGAQGVPPNTVLIGLALFLTAFVMQPVLEQGWRDGLAADDGGAASAKSRAWPRTGASRSAASWQPRYGTPSWRSSSTSPACRASRRRGPGSAALAGPAAGLPRGRAEAGLRDRLPAVPAVPGDRHGGRQPADVARHDDAAAQRGLTAVQADLLRLGRWLAPGRRAAWCRGSPAAEPVRRRTGRGCGAASAQP